jgi:hypothetical protein
MYLSQAPPPYATIQPSRRKSTRDFVIYCDPPSPPAMSSNNIATVSAFIEGAPPGEVCICSYTTPEAANQA